MNIVKCSTLVECKDFNIITTGSMLQAAIDISSEFKKHSKKMGVVHVPCIKPIDESKLLNIISKSKKIYNRRTLYQRRFGVFHFRFII